MKPIHYFFLAILFLLPSWGYCQNNCADIIKIAFGVEESAESSDATNTIFNFLKSDKLREYVTKQGGGFNLGFDGFGIGFNSTTQDYSKFRDYLNSQNSSEEKEKIVRKTLKQIPNRRAYDVWIACINRKTQGIYFDYYEAGESYQLSIAYNPYPDIYVISIDYVSIENATYDTMLLRKGTILQSVPVEIVLRPITKENDIVISLVATGNTVNAKFSKPFVIPAKLTQQISIDTFVLMRHNCIEKRQTEACMSCALELNRKYSNKINALAVNNPQDLANKSELQIALDKLVRFYENCVFSINDNRPFDKELFQRFEYDFKTLLIRNNLSY
jgi:hypothetical protein